MFDSGSLGIAVRKWSAFTVSRRAASALQAVWFDGSLNARKMVVPAGVKPATFPTSRGGSIGLSYGTKIGALHRLVTVIHTDEGVGY